MWRATLVGVSWALAVACGSGAESNPPPLDGGAGGSGATDGAAGSGATGGTGGSSGAAGTGAAGAAGSGGSSGSSGGGGTGGGDGGPTPSPFDCRDPEGPVPALRLTPLERGLDYPVLAVSPPGDVERLVIVEQTGLLRLRKNGVLSAEPFLDVSERVSFGGERGLLGLAFSPDYATTGEVYVHYSARGGGDTVIARFRRDTADPDRLDPGSFEQIFTIQQPEGNHNGGSIEFGPDGMLYIAMGDGGGAEDRHGPVGNGQSLATRLGKILRIDPRGGQPFAVPPGNMTGPDVEPTIWSYGWRNPWRASFDPCTGDFYAGDVGQYQWEEINVEPRGTPSGRNYGWRLLEGTHCFNPSTNCDPGSVTTLPVAEYDHSQGVAVTGGYVYRGSRLPGLRGQYLYADYGSGRFWRFAYRGGRAEGLQEITSTINEDRHRRISSFGQDARGELYVTVLSDTFPDDSRNTGHLYRIDPR